MPAHGEQEALRLVGPQVEQHVGLVLGCVDALEQPDAAVRGVQPGVVARCNVVDVQRGGLLHQEVELDLVVAGQAGMRRAAPQVLAAEVVDDVVVELLLEAHHVVGRADNLAHPSCVLDVVQGAATLELACGPAGSPPLRRSKASWSRPRPRSPRPSAGTRLRRNRRLHSWRPQPCPCS